ncbi:MAG: SelB C-terminal domain-containing protein [Oligoflexia bacterium]|nr:SelB C-terminal domain-containing protein [Oligoflexia bacterium]
MRSLILATAGHVDHGKSTFVKYLTGLDPDRLPEEKTRGMTLDLGFASVPGISFIDCPGHESFIKHLVAGQSAVDGACLIIAMNEGIQEQTLEHIRILNWLGTKQVMIVVTKTDLTDTKEDAQYQASEIYEQAQKLFLPDVRTELLLVSHHIPRHDAINKIKTFFKPIRQITNHFYNRFFLDRIFTINGAGSIVTGSFSEGEIETGTRGLIWLSNNKKPRPVVVKTIRHEHFAPQKWLTAGRVAFGLDGVSPEEVPRGSVLLFQEKLPPLARSLALNLDWAIEQKKQFTATIQVGTLCLQAKLRLHPKGFWRAYLEMPAPIMRGDKLVVRLPERIEGLGQTVAAGNVLDAYLPTRQIKSAPPQDTREFIKWCRESEGSEKYDLEDWALRLGLPNEEVKQYVDLFRKNIPQVKPEKPKMIDERLLRELEEKKWEGFVKEDELDRAHTLVKAHFVKHVKANHFLHNDHYNELLNWLESHFQKHEELTLDHARDFFKIGRKHFIHLLEFCDRLHFTFRKELVRKPFKLPSYPPPLSVRPTGARADGPQSGHPVSGY